MKAVLLAVAMMIGGGAATAQAVSSAQAEAQLFPPGRQVVQLSSQLSDADKATIKALIPLMEGQMQTQVLFYSSIAYAPGEGLVGKGLQGAFNHHTPAAADRAALRACTAEKSRGSGACRIAARVLPRGYSARPLSLSSAATSAFSANYQRQRAPKALAISPSTGAWGIGAGDQAAVTACRRGGARDCEIAIRN